MARTWLLVGLTVASVLAAPAAAAAQTSGDDCAAAQRLVQEKPGQTLQPTALVHEAYLRLVGPADAHRWNEFLASRRIRNAAK